MQAAECASTAVADNLSLATECVEEDNINVPLSGDPTSFLIAARHPEYDVGSDSCIADDCAQGGASGFSFVPKSVKLCDDGVTAVWAITKAEWWRPAGMSAACDAKPIETDVHRIVIYRKIKDEPSFPQVLVFYQDGYLRLKPHPPPGITDVCFGSSVVVGPAPIAERPYAEVASVLFESASSTLHVDYVMGGSADIKLKKVNRKVAKVKVKVAYQTFDPFATFRSMFVKAGDSSNDGRNDVERVNWKDPKGVEHDEGVLEFQGGAGTRWRFYRKFRSSHPI